MLRLFVMALMSGILLFGCANRTSVKEMEVDGEHYLLRVPKGESDEIDLAPQVILAHGREFKRIEDRRAYPVAMAVSKVTGEPEPFWAFGSLYAIPSSNKPR